MFSYAGAPWRFLNLIPSPTPSHPLHTLQCKVKGDLAPCLIICIHHLSNVSISSDSTVLVSLVKIGQNKQLDYELMFSLSSSSIRDWQGNKAKSFFLQDYLIIYHNCFFLIYSDSTATFIQVVMSSSQSPGQAGSTFTPFTPSSAKLKVTSLHVR